MSDARKLPLVLVTGGTGFLGSHLVRDLVAAGGARIRVLSTSPPEWLSALDVETVSGSLLNPADVARAVDSASVICHLAGRVAHAPVDAREVYALHVDGTRLLCDAACAAGVGTMILASSSGTLAVAKSGDVVSDENRPSPLDVVLRWPYYASKVYQERVALERFSGPGRRLVILNPSLVLGPGDERLSSTKLVLDFLARTIPIVPPGGFSFVDVRDAARAFRAAIHRGRHGERYLLGAANWTFREFFDRLQRLTKTSGPRLPLPPSVAAPGARLVGALYRRWKLAPPVEPAEVEMASHFWYVDATKAQRELGFSPRDPAETLHDTVTYVRRTFLDAAVLA
jgi:dihydroflavonol-4-reductase